MTSKEGLWVGWVVFFTQKLTWTKISEALKLKKKKKNLFNIIEWLFKKNKHIV